MKDQFKIIIDSIPGFSEFEDKEYNSRWGILYSEILSYGNINSPIDWEYDKRIIYFNSQESKEKYIFQFDIEEYKE